MPGDITVADDVRRAATGADSAVHCAALLGGASQNLPDFEAVNVQGTKHVLDAAEALGMRRVVAVSTGTFFDTTGGLDREDAPVLKEPSSDPYTVTKMAAFQRRDGSGCGRTGRGHDAPGGHLRSVAGREQCPRPHQLQPGASVCPARTHHAVSDVSDQLGLLRGHRARCILALDRGVPGERYMLDGRPEDVVSTAAACNRICTLAGVDHRVEDIAPSDDPELLEVFGPTLMAIAFKLASVGTPRGDLKDSKTYKRLGYDPISLDEGLQHSVDWLRHIGRVDTVSG